MSIATRATSHTRGAGLPHLGQATDTWLQRTCRIAHGTAPTAGQVGSTDEGPRRATTGPLLRQFRTLGITEGYRPGNSGWSTLASAIPPRWEAGGGRHLALAGDDPRCA